MDDWDDLNEAAEAEKRDRIEHAERALHDAVIHVEALADAFLTLPWRTEEWQDVDALASTKMAVEFAQQALTHAWIHYMRDRPYPTARE